MSHHDEGLDYSADDGMHEIDAPGTLAVSHRTPISELTTPGIPVTSFYLCKAASTKTTSTNKPYVALTLSDETGDIEARIWGVGLDRFPGVAAGVVVKIGAITESYEGKIQLKVEQHGKFRAADPQTDDFQPADFMRRAKRDAGGMLTDLDNLIGFHVSGVAHDVLSRILSTFRESILIAPASMKLHHPYLGGLLEHTLSLVHASIWAAEKYGLNKDIMIGIALCHDIGKIVELDPMKGNEYTRSGRLFGHITIGHDIVRDAFDQALVTAEDEPIREGILHGILSHHGSLEFGSPVVPCTQEAIAFHHLDMLDSRMSMYKEAVRADSNQGEFTSYERHFGGALLKGSK